ncbi:hypothetical protein AAFF_G00178230 [Aldrovandia affinis]|uniref:Uncharacterized protein n=1 Tax=Aldrovandia affinis TaxID=143900 RepID=A0AAD7RL98_9TELE|nr:hypothetical protein AAFF_G00178230 [Aldrovandia affinis]
MVETLSIAVIGAPGVGKTSIIRQFIYNDFSEVYTPTRSRYVYRPSVILNGSMYDLKILDVPPISSFPASTSQLPAPQRRSLHHPHPLNQRQGGTQTKRASAPKPAVPKRPASLDPQRPRAKSWLRRCLLKPLLRARSITPISASSRRHSAAPSIIPTRLTSARAARSSETGVGPQTRRACLERD